VSTWRDERRPAVEADPRRVGEYLDPAARGLGVPKAGILGIVFSKWADLVGPEIAAHAEPGSLRDGVLTVVVDQPAWAAQLRYLGSDLVAKIAEFAGSSEVSKVEFRVAPAGSSGSREKSPGRGFRDPD
jgi:predicted nucleic acid-binding Zn ribbon protein